MLGSLREMQIKRLSLMHVNQSPAPADAKSTDKLKIEEKEKRLVLTSATSSDFKAIVGRVANFQCDSIVLENCDISIADITSLPISGSIKSIQFKNATRIKGWEKLGELSQLETLIISEARVESKDLENLNLLKLKTLAFRSCPFIDQTDFITKQAATLKTLVLDSCIRITSLEFLRGLDLETLELNSVAGNEERDFIAIGANHNLKKLTLLNYHLLDALDFVETLKVLSELKVENCVQLVDIQKVATLKKTLKILSFEGCSGLAEHGKWIRNLGIPETTIPLKPFSHRRAPTAIYFRASPITIFD